MLKSSGPAGRPLDAVRRRDAARRLAGCTSSSPTSPASTGRSTSASSSSARRTSTSWSQLGTLTAAGGALPRGGGRQRAQRPRRRRHPGRQDDAAELPGRGDPGARAGGHLRGGLRAARSRCPTWWRCRCRQPSLEGTGEIRLRRLVKEALRMRPVRIIVGEVRQEECLDLLIALNRGLPGMCTIHANSAREAVTKMCTLPLLAGENVGHAFVVPTVAGCIDLVVHIATERRRPPAGARDRRRPGPGRGRRRRDRRPVRHAAATGWCAPTATRRTPSGSSGPAIDLAALLAPVRRSATDGRAARPAASGSGCSWSGGPFAAAARRAARTRPRCADRIARAARAGRHRGRHARRAASASCVGVGGRRARR